MHIFIILTCNVQQIFSRHASERQASSVEDLQRVQVYNIRKYVTGGYAKWCLQFIVFT